MWMSRVVTYYWELMKRDTDNWHVDEPGSDLLLGVDKERH